MANPDARFGFRPYMPMGGTPGRIGKYTLASAYGTALFQGDTVKTTGTGLYGRANVAISTGNTDQIVGVFAGVEYTAPDGSVVRKNNWVASTATKAGTPIWAFVHDDPTQLFIAQCDGTTVVTDIGAWAGVVTTHAGNATTGISGQEISTGQGSETTFKIVSLIDAQDGMPCRNDVGNQDLYQVGLNGLVVVRIVKHDLGAVAATEV
jgi:hypothetical protein